MNKTAERLLTFFIGIPIIVGCVAFSFCNHLLLHLAILITSTVVAFEMHGILSKAMSTQNKFFIIILSDLIPFTSSICVVFHLPEIIISFVTVAVLMAIFVCEIWGYDPSTRIFEKSIQRLGSSLITITFCGYFMSFISRMASFPEISAFVSLFLMLIFGCDSCAWLFGVSMGKNNRGYVAASPNKSIMGFIGGFTGPFIAILIAFACFPVLKTYPFWKISILAVSISVTAIFGDLVESVLKRCSNTKDSGNLIPGRGGLLDSADSIIFSAPVFYFLVKILFGI